MSHAKKFVAALSMAGAMLASSPASFAQQRLTSAYVAGVYADCYYNVSLTCGPVNGAYAAITPFAGDAYAAVNGVVRPPYLATSRWIPLGLSGGDWVAIHGSNF